MPAASLETTLELWSTTLRQAKPRMRPLFAAASVATSANAFLATLAQHHATGAVRHRLPGGAARGRAAKARLDASRGRWRSWPLAAAGHPGAQPLDRRCSARCGARILGAIASG